VIKPTPNGLAAPLPGERVTFLCLSFIVQIRPDVRFPVLFFIIAHSKADRSRANSFYCSGLCSSPEGSLLIFRDGDGSFDTRSIGIAIPPLVLLLRFSSIQL